MSGKNMIPKFIVITGDGINCENETKFAIEAAGASGDIVHINELLKTPKTLKAYQALAIPGGFSFGDELGSGQILALKIRHGLMDEFKSFIEEKKPIIGICNGFQVLTKLGLLPGWKGGRLMALAQNDQGTFVDKWCKIKVNKNSKCVWTKNMSDTISLPIRHGEGRVVFKKGCEEEIFERLLEKGQIPLSYSENINGSYKKIAAICDETGLILGMMPHPEAAIFKATDPLLSLDYDQPSYGYKIFENIIHFLQKR